MSEPNERTDARVDERPDARARGRVAERPGAEGDPLSARTGMRDDPVVAPSPKAGARTGPDAGSLDDPGREPAERRAAQEAAGPDPHPGPGRPGPQTDPQSNGHGHGHGHHGLLPSGETERLGGRLRHAVGGFVDEPRHAVEEADAVLEEAAARIAEAVEERRRELRSTWQDNGTAAGTEDLRVALREYRDLVEELLHA